MNRLRHRLTGIAMTDHGSMLRAYSRNVVAADQPVQRDEHLHPGAGLQFSRNPAEVVVGHEERHAGESKYSFYSLMRLNFDLVTGFSLVPLQAFSMLGHRGVAAVGAAVRDPGGAPDRAGARGRRRLHAVRPAVPADRAGAVRHRPAGRIHRPHLPGGAGAPALRHQRRAGAQAPHDTDAPSSSPTTTSACAACGCCSTPASRCRWSSPTPTPPARPSGSPAWPAWRRRTACAA